MVVKKTKKKTKTDNPLMDFFLYISQEMDFFFPPKKKEQKEKMCRSNNASVLQSFPRGSLALGGRGLARTAGTSQRERLGLKRLLRVCAAVISTAQASGATGTLKH